MLRRFVLPLFVIAAGSFGLEACDTNNDDSAQGSLQRGGALVTAREWAEPTIQLSVDFRFTGDEIPHLYEVACGPRTGSNASSPSVCEAISKRKALFLPFDELECPLPVPALYVHVEGSYDGDKLGQTLTPCSDAESRAIAAWADTLDFSLKEPR